MQEKNWTVGIDIGCEITQVSYMTEGMKEPETLEQLFETRFTAEEQLSFIEECLLAIPGLEELADIRSLELVLPEFSLEKAEEIKNVCERLGIAANAVHMQGTAEAAIYFALSQEQSLWNNDVIFFDFSKNGLVYRNLHVDRKNGRMIARLTEEHLEEIKIEQPSDEMFLRLAQERMEKRIISAVYLIGEGFYGEEWAKESLKYLCSRRRVFKGLNLYTRGATFAAYDRIHSQAYEQVVFLCKECLKASVGIHIMHRGEPKLLYLAKAGKNWYESRALIEAIPDEISTLELVLQSWNGEEVEEEVLLKEFPVRERRMMRLEISLAFLNETHGVLTVRDLGFGSLIPATEMVVKKDIRILEVTKREQSE